MSARVNLIPREVEERNRARRQQLAVAAGGLVLLVLLGLAYLYQVGRLNDAQEELENERAVVAQLQEELDKLEEFRALEDQLDDSEDLLEVALGDEVTMAGALQDLAAVIPTNTEIDTLQVSIQPEEVPPLGAVRVPIGSLLATGFTLDSHAPGLERLLLELGKVAAFDNVYFTQAVLDEATGAVGFSLDVGLGPELRTQRYLDGVPEELR